MNWLSTGTIEIVLGVFAPAINFIQLYMAHGTDAWPFAATLLLLYAAVVNASARMKFIATAIFLPLFFSLCQYANCALVQITPYTMDEIFSTVEHGVSLRIYHWVVNHSLVYDALVLPYGMLIFFLSMTVVLSDRRASFVRSLVIASLFAPICYILFPAVGPAHIGDPNAPRNCMPSLHVTWAALCLLHIVPRFRWLAATFLAFTVMATIGLGEHYLIDVACAAPYTAFVMLTESAFWDYSGRARFGNLLLAPTESVAAQQ